MAKSKCVHDVVGHNGSTMYAVTMVGAHGGRDARIADRVSWGLPATDETAEYIKCWQCGAQWARVIEL